MFEPSGDLRPCRLGVKIDSSENKDVGWAQVGLPLKLIFVLSRSDKAGGPGQLELPSRPRSALEVSSLPVVKLEGSYILLGVRSMAEAKGVFLVDGVKRK